jgi:hypothetical protein
LRIDCDVSRLGSHSSEPAAHCRVQLEVEAALGRDVRVRVEREVGEGQAVSHEELPAVEVTFHCRESPVSRCGTFGEAIGELIRTAGVREPESGNRDRRLVVVLLEEHPLQNLRAVVRILWNEAGALTEIPEDRARFRERPTVVQHECWNAQRRVQLAQHVSSIRAVDDVHRSPLVRDAEVGEQQANLVAVA